MPPKESKKKAQAKLEQEADNIVSVFNQAADSAAETQLEYVCGVFHQNLPLLYTISGMMKSDTLTALLDGRARGCGVQPEEPKVVKEGRPIRAAMKKFRQVSMQASLLDASLAILEPQIFTAEKCMALSDQEKTGLLCYAVRADLETRMPHFYFDISTTVDLVAAFSQKYAAENYPMRGKTIATMLQGFWIVEGTNVFSALDSKTGEDRTKAMYEGASQVTVREPWLLSTAAVVKYGEKEFTSMDLAATFHGAEGVAWFESDAKWSLPAFAERAIASPSPPPLKKARGETASPAPGSASSSCSGVSSILAGRLAKKGAAIAGGTNSGA